MIERQEISWWVSALWGQLSTIRRAPGAGGCRSVAAGLPAAGLWWRVSSGSVGRFLPCGGSYRPPGGAADCRSTRPPPRGGQVLWSPTTRWFRTSAACGSIPPRAACLQRSWRLGTQPSTTIGTGTSYPPPPSTTRSRTARCPAFSFSNPPAVWPEQTGLMSVVFTLNAPSFILGLSSKQGQACRSQIAVVAEWARDRSTNPPRVNRSGVRNVRRGPRPTSDVTPPTTCRRRGGPGGRARRLEADASSASLTGVPRRYRLGGEHGGRSWPRRSTRGRATFCPRGSQPSREPVTAPGRLEGPDGVVVPGGPPARAIASVRSCRSASSERGSRTSLR